MTPEPRNRAEQSYNQEPHMTFLYVFNLDNGPLRIELPDRLSEADCDDVEQLFELALRSARRRLKKILDCPLPEAEEQV